MINSMKISQILNTLFAKRPSTNFTHDIQFISIKLKEKAQRITKLDKKTNTWCADTNENGRKENKGLKNEMKKIA